MKDAIRMSVRHMRLGEIAAGNLVLSRIVDDLAELLQKPPLSENQSDVLFLLRMIIDAMERGDHLYVADLLEYELAAML